MKFILLTGHRKSGTTLLHRLFDGHPGLNIYPVDISLLYAFYPCWSQKELSCDEIKNRISLVIKKSTAAISGKRISDEITKFDPNEFLEVFWSIRNEHGLKKPGAILETLAKAYCIYARLDDSKPFLFKETSQAVNLQKFRDEGLDLKMLQLVRDPRDNYAAIKEGVLHYYNKMGESEIESLASVLNRAKLDLEIGKHEVIAKTPNFFAVRFEDLVVDIESVMSSIASQLNISWDDKLLKPSTLGEDFFGNNHSGKRFNGVSKKNVARWRDRITDAEACLIEGWMADVMQYWGYQSEFKRSEQLRAVADFYAWYNCRFFYRDSFLV